jgi:hypothetical protein
MAARPNTSLFTIIFTVIIGVLALVLFITTIVFASKFNRAQESRRAAEQDRSQVLDGASEEDRTFARRLAEGRSAGELVGAVEAYRDLAAYVGGNTSRTPSEIAERLTEDLRSVAQQALERGNWQNTSGDQAQLAAELRELANASPDDPPDLDRSVQTLVLAFEQTIADRAELERTLRTTLTNAQQAIARVEEARQEFERFQGQQLTRVDSYADSVEDYSADVQQAKGEFQSEISRIRGDAEDVIDEKDQQIASLQDEIDQLRQIIDRLDRPDDIISPRDEGTLIDGQVIGVSVANQDVFISLGRGDKLPIGITFRVYDETTAIRPNAQGVLPPGKAVIEVVRVDDETATARILQQSRGNPISAGDKIVNAIYDPEKVYRFVVFGNFDTNGDFIATPAETNAIKALVREWGGTVQDDITGQTDFVVLGERPILPIAPGLEAPRAVRQRYAEARSRQVRYEDLFEQATNASIPVLNQNRLNTLTGLEAR